MIGHNPVAADRLFAELPARLAEQEAVDCDQVYPDLCRVIWPPADSKPFQDALTSASWQQNTWPTV